MQAWIPFPKAICGFAWRFGRNPSRPVNTLRRCSLMEAILRLAVACEERRLALIPGLRRKDKPGKTFEGIRWYLWQEPRLTTSHSNTKSFCSKRLDVTSGGHSRCRHDQRTSSPITLRPMRYPWINLTSITTEASVLTGGASKNATSNAERATNGSAIGAKCIPFPSGPNTPLVYHADRRQLTQVDETLGTNPFK